MPKIELIKVLRDCPFNKRPENSRRLIRDVKVVIDDEHRATWENKGKSNGYRLQSITGRAIMDQKYPMDPSIVCRGLGNTLEQATEEHLDLIPTLTQYAEMEQKENERVRHLELEQANRECAMKIAAAAPALRNALQSLVAAFARHDGCSRYCVGDAAVLRDAEELLRTLPPPTEPCILG